MKKLLLLLVFALPCYGQLGNMIVKNYADATAINAAACSGNQYAKELDNGHLWQCFAGVYLEIGPGAAGTTTLNTVLDPTANKAFTMGAFTLNFNTSSNSSTANPFSFSDFATNTGTGYLFTVSSGSSSAVKPFRVCYRGTTNCITFDTTTLTGIGTATVNANLLNGTALSSLATGVLKNTTTTGVPSIAAYTDIVAMWASGLCSGFLKSDGTCASAGGTGTVTVVSSGALNSTSLVTGGGTTTLQTPSNGSTLDSSGNMVLAGSLTTSGPQTSGTAPAGIANTASGVWGCTESGSTGLTPTATTSWLHCDSVSHQMKVSLNGAAEVNMLTSAGLAAIASGKTLTVSNSMTQTATDGSTVAFGGGGTVLYSGGALGTPASGTLTNATGLPAAGVVAGALANGMTATTQAADDNSTKVATTAYVDRMKTKTITFSFGAPEGSTLTTGLTRYVTVPFGCTISAYNLLADAGTFTVKFWKVATGTAIPTVSNSISTSGVSLATGTALHSTTVSDFTTTTVTANDIMAANITALATAKFVQAQVQCDQ